jgi:adenine deaminase
MQIEGHIVDVINRRIFQGVLTIENGIIIEISPKESDSDIYIMPGFVDSHIHIESSMLTPFEFGKIAIRHGTVATVSDPHEIANVLGLDGIEFMIRDASQSPLKFYFGAPSCVPATFLETSGAIVSSADLEALLKREDLKYLSEMMNYPGVIYDDPKVIEKLEHAHRTNKPIDGHAPGLSGSNLAKYIDAGISTDHECSSIEEAIEKISLGMKILIREGSAARNFNALKSLLDSYNDMVMLCSDDLHPDDLLKGHINLVVKRAIADGFDLFDILRACTLNPIRHYSLDVGLVQVGSPADFIVVDNLSEFNILGTYIDGREVYRKNEITDSIKQVEIINVFNAKAKHHSDFQVPFSGGKIKVIEITDGELLTGELQLMPKVQDSFIVTDIERDILKISVINRYNDTKPAVGFVKNFGIRTGAVASCFAHDSHNIICIGTNDLEMAKAANTVITNKGGIAVTAFEEEHSLELPIAGIISDKSCEYVAREYSKLNKILNQIGSKLISPLMTMSFMALIVIPKLKISDRGLFDVEKFEFTDLQI